MCANNLNELVVDGLKHAYYAEQQRVDATEELANQLSESDIEETFSEHHAEIQTFSLEDSPRGYEMFTEKENGCVRAAFTS